MSRMRCKAEQIVNLLWKIEVEIDSGRKRAQAAREVGICEQTCYASQYARYGYQRITALVKQTGWQVGKGWVERTWRREGLKVPQKQRPRRRLW